MVNHNYFFQYKMVDFHLDQKKVVPNSPIKVFHQNLSVSKFKLNLCNSVHTCGRFTSLFL